MPRYEYRCNECELDLIVQHLSDEIADVCPVCQQTGTLEKKLSNIRTTSRSRQSKRKVGETTEEFIKTSRDDLQQQKDDLDKAR